MKLLILRLLVAADLASAYQVNKDLFSLEADDQDCLWRRLFLAVCTNHPAPNRLPLPPPSQRGRVSPFPLPLQTGRGERKDREDRENREERGASFSRLA